MRLIKSISYDDPKEHNPFILSENELTKICKYPHMEEQCCIGGLLTPADNGMQAGKTGAKKKKIGLKMRHIFLLNSLVINHWRS